MKGLLALIPAGLIGCSTLTANQPTPEIYIPNDNNGIMKETPNKIDYNSTPVHKIIDVLMEGLDPGSGYVYEIVGSESNKLWRFSAEKDHSCTKERLIVKVPFADQEFINYIMVDIPPYGNLEGIFIGYDPELFIDPEAKKQRIIKKFDNIPSSAESLYGQFIRTIDAKFKKRNSILPDILEGLLDSYDTFIRDPETHKTIADSKRLSLDFIPCL
ncbi:MAG: hypothetical protein AABX05_04080 [Nanoarchaeota archaeon]